jgi:hypothetical protein
MKKHILFALGVMILLLSACALNESQREPDNSGSAAARFESMQQSFALEQVFEHHVPMTPYSEVTSSGGAQYRLSNGAIIIDGVETLSAPSNSMIVGIALGGDGNVYAHVKRIGLDDAVYAVAKAQIVFLFSFSDEILRILPGSKTVPFYVVCRNNLYAYHEAIAVIYRFPDLSEFGIVPANIIRVDERANDGFTIYEGLSAMAFELSLGGSTPDKTTLTIAVVGSSVLAKDIAKFNSENPNCKIKLLLYDADNIAKLFTEINSGNAPDMIDLAYLKIPQSQWDKLFINLYPYIMRDSETAPSEFWASAWEALSRNKSVYSVLT